jgi:Xaa-Pro aminopeptidase
MTHQLVDQLRDRPHIPRAEFLKRIGRIQDAMATERLDVCVVYGDEYRREDLRYVSNYWPIFERGATVIPATGSPILLCAPECEKLAREMSVWEEIRVIPDFTCVTVPESISYPHAHYVSLRDALHETVGSSGIQRAGIVGLDAMSSELHRTLLESSPGTEWVDMAGVLTRLRLIKSPAEVRCLREAARIADAAYASLMASSKPGTTELAAAAAAHRTALEEGAEHIAFTVYGSGARSDTIVGRPTRKTIQSGDMIMAAVAIQYEGYIATVEFPFVVGKMRSDQKMLIGALIEAEGIAFRALRPGANAADLVRQVKAFFDRRGLSQYDLYPPLHGSGLAEAESPYPDEHSCLILQPGLTVNTDVSLFGHPVGSNRVEEGFAITDQGVEPLSLLVRELAAKWLAGDQ